MPSVSIHINPAFKKHTEAFFQYLWKAHIYKLLCSVKSEIQDKQGPSPQGVHILVEKIRHTRKMIIKVANDKFHKRGADKLLQA